MTDRLTALAYHRLSEHSPVSVQTNRHFMDWDNQPLPLKIYSDLEPLPLPREFSRRTPDSGAPLDRTDLARLLHYTGGIVRKKLLDDGSEYYFRAAACTGALYHIDLYVVCADLADLDAGVYHFGPHDFALRRLRAGDHRRVVVGATGDDPAAARAPIIVAATSTFWRNAWKYQSRAYRHGFWDSGTMLANLLETAAASDVATRVLVGFADDPVNELLGLDTKREVALACVALGTTDRAAPPPPALASLEYRTTPLSRDEVDYPAIRAAHAGTSLDTPEDAREFRGLAFSRALPDPVGTLVPLASGDGVTSLPVEQAIVRRGSARRFERAPITGEHLSHILRSSVIDIDADWAPRRATDGGPALLNDVYLIVNAVEGVAPGTYVYRRENHALELLKQGDFRRDAGYLDLGQELGADASVNFYVLSDLREVVEHLGDRGYRAAALEAGIIGGRIYLASYGLGGLGATGLTFFDDDVTAFFSPHAAGKGVMFLIAVGRPQRPNT
jgi:SagB-type dehydrogenase family enzyme